MLLIIDLIVNIILNHLKKTVHNLLTITAESKSRYNLVKNKAGVWCAKRTLDAVT